MNKEFRKLCTPAKIYFAITVIMSTIALFSGVKIMVVLFRLMFGFLWTFLLGWLCSKGFTSISWFLVLLPYIIFFAAMFKLFHLTQEQKQMLKTLQMEGVVGTEGMVTQHKVAKATKYQNNNAQEETV
jgi:Ca2+/Na+ antiporter